MIDLLVHTYFAGCAFFSIWTFVRCVKDGWLPPNVPPFTMMSQVAVTLVAALFFVTMLPIWPLWFPLFVRRRWIEFRGRR